MPATPLPPSGDVPAKAKTCDASGMAEIHRMFTTGFGEAPGLVRGVAAGDAAMPRSSPTQLDLLSTAVHAHHEGRTSGCGERSRSARRRAPRMSSG